MGPKGVFLRTTHDNLSSKPSSRQATFTTPFKMWMMAASANTCSSRQCRLLLLLLMIMGPMILYSSLFVLQGLAVATRHDDGFQSGNLLPTVPAVDEPTTFSRGEKTLQHHRLEKMRQLRSVAFQDPLAALLGHLFEVGGGDALTVNSASSRRQEELYELQQQNVIHIAVTTILTAAIFLGVPLFIVLLVWITRKTDEFWKDENRRSQERRKRRSRRERIQESLSKFRVRLPATTEHRTATRTLKNGEIQIVTTRTISATVAARRECPICLERFVGGEQVIMSNACSCSRNKTAFHEPCLVRWLMEKRNPRQVCPCCRSPMLKDSKVL